MLYREGRSPPCSFSRFLSSSCSKTPPPTPYLHPALCPGSVPCPRPAPFNHTVLCPRPEGPKAQSAQSQFYRLFQVASDHLMQKVFKNVSPRPAPCLHHAPFHQPAPCPRLVLCPQSRSIRHVSLSCTLFCILSCCFSNWLIN